MFTPFGYFNHRSTCDPHRPRGFTLVELLIVIGIIAVLAALGLSSYRRANESAARTMCASNLSQIGKALIAYAQDNNQTFPFPASRTVPTPTTHRAEDWLHWKLPTQGGAASTDFNRSAIVRYVRVKDEGLQKLLRCPSDDVETRPSTPPYRYSYVINFYMTPAAAGGYDSPRGRIGAVAPLGGVIPRVTAINRGGEKILAVEENVKTIRDGEWIPGRYTDAERETWVVSNPSNQSEYLSIRHDNRNAEHRSPINGQLPKQTKRGQVVFVDGHVDFVSRKFAHTPQNVLPNNEGTGSVSADPDP